MSERPDYTKWSEYALRVAAQGCTEFTCIYHGVINFELARRGVSSQESASEQSS